MASAALHLSTWQATEETITCTFGKKGILSSRIHKAINCQKQEGKQTLSGFSQSRSVYLCLCLTVGRLFDIPHQAGRVKGGDWEEVGGEQGLFLYPPTHYHISYHAGPQPSVNSHPLLTHCKAHGIYHWGGWNGARYTRGFHIMMLVLRAEAFDVVET